MDAASFVGLRGARDGLDNFVPVFPPRTGDDNGDTIASDVDAIDDGPASMLTRVSCPLATCDCARAVVYDSANKNNINRVAPTTTGLTPMCDDRTPCSSLSLAISSLATSLTLHIASKIRRAASAPTRNAAAASSTQTSSSSLLFARIVANTRARIAYAYTHSHARAPSVSAPRRARTHRKTTRKHRHDDDAHQTRIRRTSNALTPSISGHSIDAGTTVPCSNTSPRTRHDAIAPVARRAVAFCARIVSRVLTVEVTARDELIRRRQFATRAFDRTRAREGCANDHRCSRDRPTRRRRGIRRWNRARPERRLVSMRWGHR